MLGGRGEASLLQRVFVRRVLPWPGLDLPRLRRLGRWETIEGDEQEDRNDDIGTEARHAELSVRLPEADSGRAVCKHVGRKHLHRAAAWAFYMSAPRSKTTRKVGKERACTLFRGLGRPTDGLIDKCVSEGVTEHGRAG